VSGCLFLYIFLPGYLFEFCRINAKLKKITSMKTSLKIGLLAISISIVTAGCFGCGEKTKGGSTEKIDTGKTAVDSPKKGIDTIKTKIDSGKKDTSKK
jgi:hypothetical protein